MTPTPRECKEIIVEILAKSLVGAAYDASEGCPICLAEFPGHQHEKDCKASILLSRLTDEAIEKDEKRRAVVERIADVLLEDGVHGSNGRHRGEMENAGVEAPCELCDLLDALTLNQKDR